MTDSFPPVVRSKAVILRLDNVDTDVITPIARVLQGRSAVVTYAFEPIRFSPSGELLPRTPFSDPERRGAEILVAGRNFGCGSSRETAAWAIRGLGFRVVIAESFGDIFYSNCLKNGVLAIRLLSRDVDMIMEAADALAEIEIDLAGQIVRAQTVEYHFEIGLLHKQMLASGQDEIGMMEARQHARDNFEKQDSSARPWVRRRRRRV